MFEEKHGGEAAVLGQCGLRAEEAERVRPCVALHAVLKISDFILRRGAIGRFYMEV